MLECVEAAFDAVALFIQCAVVASGLFPMPPWRNHGYRAQTVDFGDDLGRVIALVRDHGFGLPAVKQLDGFGILAGLAGGDAECDRQAILVRQQMNLNAQTSSGTPQSRVLRVPFLRPAAAC